MFITLLRHGESERNLSGVLQGQSDYPLTPAGLEQARQLASIWKFEDTKFDLTTSSPLRRAPQAHYNSPIFHFGNTGYAQFSYNLSTRQWAILCFNDQIKLPQSGGFISWKTD